MDGHVRDDSPTPRPVDDPNRRRSYPTVVVSVGTDHHPFDRLVGWIDEWVDLNPAVDVLVQRGNSAEPRRCRSTQLIPHPELCEFFARATVVVSHGGPSTVMDARMTGHRPIVVARDPGYGEHVDDHQRRFARHLDRHGLAEVVETKTALFHAIAQGLARPDSMRIEIEADAVPGIVEFGRVVDQLLSTTTPLVPPPPSDVGAILSQIGSPFDEVGDGVRIDGFPGEIDGFPGEIDGFPGDEDGFDQ